MKSISIRLTKSRILFIILSLSVMVLIFHLSAENASKSTSTSGNVIKMIFSTFVPHFDEFDASKQRMMIRGAQHIVRKLAHFSIYTTLGFCISFACGKRKFISRMTLEALTLGFLYAVSDEIHQSHVPGRSCEFRDVMIDTCGTFTGILLSFAVIYIISCIKKRKKNKNQKAEIGK